MMTTVFLFVKLCFSDKTAAEKYNEKNFTTLVCRVAYRTVSDIDELAIQVSDQNKMSYSTHCFYIF